MTISLKRNYLLACAILAGALLASFALVTHAQDAGAAAQSATVAAGTSDTSGITFPVPELGNCADKDACRAYCNDTAHIDACVAFAQSHGLMNKSEADRAAKFSKELQGAGGPGGCKSPSECETFCSNIANIDVCVKFAEAHGATGLDIETGKKVGAYVKSGGAMPGGCTSKDTCKAYCGDFSHADECAAFAKKAGIMQGVGTASGGQSAPPPQLLTLIKNGQTPGGCTSKDACEAYCKDDAHRDECTAFAEKAGFIKHDEAQNLRQSGFTGPGGCNSQESCSAYCNDQTHHDECYTFAEAHGFLKKEDVAQQKQGIVSLKAGIEHASPEVASCITSTVGESAITDIQSGKFTPGSDIGGQVRGCFEKFGKPANPADIFKNAPPEVLSCVKAKLGTAFDAFASGKAMPTPEMGDTLRVCFQAMELENGQSNTTGQGQFGEGGGKGTPGMMRPANPAQFLQSAPPEVSSCLKEKLGDKFQAIENGDTSAIGPDLKQTLQGCFQSFRPPEHTFNAKSGEFDVRGEGNMPPGAPNMGGGKFGPGEGGAGPQNRQGNNQFPVLPPQMSDCVASVGGSADTSADMKVKISECYQKMREQIQNGPANMPPQGAPSGTFGPQPGMMYPGQMNQPPQGSSTGGGYQYPQGGNYPDQAPSGSNYPTGQYPQGMMDPATACAKYGGTWNGSNCAIAMPPPLTGHPPAPPPGPTPPATQPTPPPPPTSSGTNPATACAQYGGTWNGSTCVMPNNTSGGTYPPPSGSYPPPSTTSPPPTSTPPPPPSGSYNTDPAQGCAQYGGTWNGSTCVMPSNH